MESVDFGELYTDLQLPSCPSQTRASRQQVVSSASPSDDEDDERREAEFDDSVVREGDDVESEDDGLLIILNDHDCPAGGHGPLNASGVGCFDDDDDDIVIVAGGDLSSKESKRAARLPSDGLEQLPHLSHYKVRFP